MLQALIPYFFAACAALALSSLVADLRRYFSIVRAIVRHATQEG